MIRLNQIRPSPENDQLYRPLDYGDPDIIALKHSIVARGVLEALVVTSDGYIVSGHRRYAAARIAGLSEVPCHVVPQRRIDDLNQFVRLLREHNLQRVKSTDEVLREEAVSIDAENAHSALIRHRRKKSDMSDFSELDTIELGQPRRRKSISKPKRPFLDAVIRVIVERKAFWPLSDRQVHYALLNNPPLRHALKPGSRYENSAACYGDLTDLLTRARLLGTIPWQAIVDPTRPVLWHRSFRSVGPFVRKEVDDFLMNYSRDYLQTQANYIEVFAEKLTVSGILQPVAAEYGLRMTVGRGYCSLDPRYKLACRFRRSGKAKLVLLLVADFDPDGLSLSESFARSMRDDFGVDQVRPLHVALTRQQIRDLRLPPRMQAKKGASTYKRFRDEHGENVYELEAVPPETLQTLLRQAIETVIDREAFEAEVEAEKAEARHLEALRQRVRKACETPESGKTS